MAIQAKPATAPTGPAPMTATLPGPGAPTPQPWAAGGPARNPLDLYNFASQNMPPWAQRAGVSPVAYAQFMQNHPQSPGAMNFAASGAPPSPGGPAGPPMLPNGRPMAMPGGPGGPPPGPGQPPAGIPPEVLARLHAQGITPPPVSTDPADVAKAQGLQDQLRLRMGGGTGLSPMVPNEPPQGGGDQLPYGNDAQAREVPPPTPMESMNGGPSQGKPDLQSMDGGPLQAKPAFRPPRPSIPDKHSMPPPTMRRPRPRMAQ